jgi:methyl-accepting chemotaxis protein
MTTKIKIISGFALMVLLLAAIAVMGYTTLRSFDSDFNEYARQSELKAAFGDMVAAIHRGNAKMYEFISTEERAAIEDVDKAMDAVALLYKDAAPLIRLPAQREMAAGVAEFAANFKALSKAVAADHVSVTRMYQTKVRPSINSLNSKLVELAELAFQFGNIKVLYSISSAMEFGGAARSSLARYAESRKPADGANAEAALRRFTDALQPIQAALTTDEGKALFRDIDIARQGKALLDSLVEMSKANRSVSDRQVKFKRDLAGIQADFDKMNTDQDADMRRVSAEMDAGNARTLAFMLSVSAAGVILGVLLAVFIITGIVRMLNELGRFAGAIASGDLEYQVNIREKGEIGEMVERMRNIPAVLRSILNDYRALEAGIEGGGLDSLGDPSKYSGGFATLIQGTNNILSRFRTVIDNIPSPVLVLDKDRKAAYMNAAGRELSGSDYSGKPPAQLFAREDTDTGRDALKTAMETKKPASAETRAHPRGREMDISYTVIPMLDAKGNIASLLQLITDLTEVKKIQRTILEVAARAAEIANRVAAASEELSAQVEEVSRGAEMQRDRVESTAGAMTEMNSTVMEVARNAGRASEQSEQTKGKANGGAELVNQVVKSINAVNKVAVLLQTNMQELGVKAESIGGVMNVISDIADQTNLLALNAAIEAARAGEAGRGFAVVADEVRKLAEKTMTATQEVGGSITAIQQSVHVNISEVSRAVTSITEATDLSDSSGAALAEIVELASSNSAVVASIATAAEEQSATSEEINRAIDEISRIVGETADGMAQSSTAVQELSYMAQELNRIIAGLQATEGARQEEDPGPAGEGGRRG